MRNPSHSTFFLISGLFFLLTPITYADPIGVDNQASTTHQKPAPLDYIHYVQAQNIKPAQPHVVLTKDCHLATDYISSTGVNSQTTSCPDGLLPYQLTVEGAALEGVGSRTYQLYCCKGEISYS